MTMGLAGRHLPIKWALRLYIPQEQSTNNAKNCFSWFLRGDTMRDQGEALSIREMVDHAAPSSSCVATAAKYSSPAYRPVGQWLP
jgi:hypothetical protein